MTFDELSSLITTSAKNVYDENFPDVQKRLQKAIESYCADNGQISIEDAISISTQAFLAEAIQLSTFNTFIVLQKIGVLPGLSQLKYPGK